MVLMGRSMGGLIATQMAHSAIGRKMFKAVILITPCYDVVSKTFWKYMPMMKALVHVVPYYGFNS